MFYCSVSLFTVPFTLQMHLDATQAQAIWKEKLKGGKSTVKHDCTLWLYCPACSLVLNAKNFSALPSHLNNLVMWDFGHKGLSVVGLLVSQEQKSAVFPPGWDLECRVSDWVTRHLCTQHCQVPASIFDVSTRLFPILSVAGSRWFM